MTTDPLTLTTERIREHIRKGRSPLEATFAVTELMTDQDAATVLEGLLAQRYLDMASADLAQMLAAKLGREVRWRHAKLGDLQESLLNTNKWKEGRGYESPNNHS